MLHNMINEKIIDEMSRTDDGWPIWDLKPVLVDLIWRKKKKKKKIRSVE